MPTYLRRCDNHVCSSDCHAPMHVFPPDFCPLCLLLTVFVSCAACGNGALESVEQCDDGNVFNGDGCDSACMFEDPGGVANGAVWLCTDEDFARSVCCPTLVNPITTQKTCSCAGQDSQNPQFTITAGCARVDVDECLQSPCVGKAVCTNYDGTLTSPGYECVCPPGMLGDGVTRCDIYVYETRTSFLLEGVSFSQFSETETVDILMAGGTLPAGTPRSDVRVQATVYDPARRRLLQTVDGGLEVEVIITSDDSVSMATMTSTVNVGSITTAFSTLYGTQVLVLSEPASVVETVDHAFGPVNTVFPGLKVVSIAYNDTSWEWIVVVKYTSGAPNTVTSMYLSKTGAPPYSKDVTDTFFVSKHPCMMSPSVCCLVDYDADYVIGGFSANVSDSVGTCDASVQSTQTRDLFNANKNDELISQLLVDYPRSSVHRISADTVELHLNRFDLRNDFAMRTDTATGYQLSFFTGMSYFTLLPTTALATIATQTRITVVATDTLTFATSSEQDYSFLQYISVGLFETKVISQSMFTHKMQFIKVAFVIPTTLSQNMRTGLVPLTSVRFALDSVLPALDDASMWMNPCYSSDATGLYDALLPNGDENPLVGLYAQSATQDCAIQPPLCTNPPAAATQNGGLIEFWFPVGDDLVDSAVLEADIRKNFYIHFDLSVVDSAGRSTVTSLFAQAPVTYLSVSRFCETLEGAQTVNDILGVSLAVGAVGVEGEWDSTMVEFRDVLRTENPLLETGAQVQALSLQSGLLTLAIEGSEAAFGASFAADFHVEIDSMVSMHFLADNKFDAVTAEMVAGSAYTLNKNANSGSVGIVLSSSVEATCASATMPGDTSCAIRQDIVNRNVVSGYAVHPLAAGVSIRDEAADVGWLTGNLFGVSEYSKAFAANFTNLVRAHYDVNDRYNKAWFINPGYTWAASATAGAQSILSLSDKMILVAVITIDDENAATGRRRMILEASVDKGTGKTSQTMRSLSQTEADGVTALRHVAESPISSRLPSIQNTQVDYAQQIADAFNAPAGRWKLVGIDVNKLPTIERYTDTQVRDSIQRSLRRGMKKFAPTATHLSVVQYSLKRTNAGASRRLLGHSESDAARRLLGHDESATGILNILVFFGNNTDNVLFTDELLQDLLDVPSLRDEALEDVPTIVQQWADKLVWSSVNLLANDGISLNQTAFVKLSATEKKDYEELKNVTDDLVDSIVEDTHEHWVADLDSSSQRTKATLLLCVLSVFSWFVVF